MPSGVPNGWPSGWEVYYVVFLSATLALGLPLSVALLSKLLRLGKNQPRAPIRESFAFEPAAPVLGKRMNTRFFLAANAALVLLTLALMLIPCVGALQKDGTGTTVLRGLISVITIATFSAIGLLYSARKGDLSWLRSFERVERVEKQEKP